MVAVNIAELRHDLEDLLKRVEAGEEIVIENRNAPFALIIPFPVREDYEAERQRLAARGVMTLGKGGPIPDSFFDLPAPKVSVKRALKALDDDRNEN